MNLSSIKAIDRMNGDVEAGSEVGDVVQPAEGIGRVRQRQAEAEHGEQTR